MPAKAAKDEAQESASFKNPNDIAFIPEPGIPATGELVEVPKTPKEIAREGSSLSASRDSGGDYDPAVGRALGEARQAPVYERVWAMDADHTTANRLDPDTFKPDCSVKR